MVHCGVKKAIVRQRSSCLQVLEDQLIFSSIGELAYDHTNMILRGRYWRRRQLIVIRQTSSATAWWGKKLKLLRIVFFLSWLSAGQR